jgi:hypothetical protein
MAGDDLILRRAADIKHTFPSLTVEKPSQSVAKDNELFGLAG